MHMLPFSTYFSKCFLGFQLCLALLSPNPSVLTLQKTTLETSAAMKEGAVAQPQGMEDSFQESNSHTSQIAFSLASLFQSLPHPLNPEYFVLLVPELFFVIVVIVFASVVQFSFFFFFKESHCINHVISLFPPLLTQGSSVSRLLSQLPFIHLLSSFQEDFAVVSLFSPHLCRLMPFLFFSFKPCFVAFVGFLEGSKSHGTVCFKTHPVIV